jgi:hypothetical protein
MMRPKVFAWLLTMDRINAPDMLVWRNCPIPNVNFVIYQLHRETSNHLFFTCHFSAACSSALGIVWDTSLDLSSRISTTARLWNKLLFDVYPSCFEHLETKEQEVFSYYSEYSELAWLTKVGDRVKPEFRDQIKTIVSELIV